MKTIKYPAPDRSKVIPLKEKDESGTLDIGWNEGVTTDSRPYGNAAKNLLSVR